MTQDPPDASTKPEQSHSLLENQELLEDRSPSGVPRRHLYHSSGRQSSFSKPPPNGEPKIPRTPNRVRFDIQDGDSSEPDLNGHIRTPNQGSNGAIEEEDNSWQDEGPGASAAQNAPLLTGFEAPSVTVAHEFEINSEGLLEDARPKSGMQSAFLNMANSIIGAGIIGQPYAFRQAGLITGILLLVGLTITVDWTIRLIVINSKLSGTNSFQSTMEYCFGRTGLIAISIAQWAFAFGGMIAFCIIVGDTIPQVLAAIFPSLSSMPFLWLLTDRRAVIILLILGISYPLSLYRDIAKVRPPSVTMARSSLRLACESIGSSFGVYGHHYHHNNHARRTCTSRS